MRFLKENTEEIIKLIVNQLGIAIFSMFLYTAAGSMQPEGENTPIYIKVLISVFAILFYFILLYTAVWEMGAKDKIRIDGGRAEEHKYRGFFMGLFANIPNVILTGISLICFGCYMLGLGEGFKGVFGVLNAIFRLFISMYLGVIEGFTAYLDVPGASVDIYYLVQTVYFVVLPLISVLVVHFSYIFGLRDIHIIPASKNKINKKKD